MAKSECPYSDCSCASAALRGPSDDDCVAESSCTSCSSMADKTVGGLGGGGGELDLRGKGVGTSTRGSLRRLWWEEGVFFRMTMAMEGWKAVQG